MTQLLGISNQIIWIFTFGMSGGGAQSALMGVTGDSALYDDYLQSIGAVQGVSDAALIFACCNELGNDKD